MLAILNPFVNKTESYIKIVLMQKCGWVWICFKRTLNAKISPKKPIKMCILYNIY